MTLATAQHIMYLPSLDFQHRQGLPSVDVYRADGKPP